MSELELNEVCPHCGEAIEDLEEYFSDQSDPRFSCPSCGEAIQGFESIHFVLTKAEKEA